MPPSMQQKALEEHKVILPPMQGMPTPSPPLMVRGSAPFQSVLLRGNVGRSPSPGRQPDVFDLLEISIAKKLHPQDSAVVAPSNPIPFKKLSALFPTVPMMITPEQLSKFDDDTLFFMFYYQQGTYEQYLAIQELKRREWIYHTKYLTWFQKYQDPKGGKGDEKTYLYFDYESGWCQRIKTGFDFELKYMENEMMP